jgi:hypothetical protein
MVFFVGFFGYTRQKLVGAHCLLATTSTDALFWK